MLLRPCFSILFWIFSLSLLLVLSTCWLHVPFSHQIYVTERKYKICRPWRSPFGNTKQKMLACPKRLQHGTATRENLRCFTDRVGWNKAGCVPVCRDATRITHCSIPIFIIRCCVHSGNTGVEPEWDDSSLLSEQRSGEEQGKSFQQLSSLLSWEFTVEGEAWFSILAHWHCKKPLST